MRKGVAIYATWLLLALGGAYLISAGLAGASMAAADGAVGRGDLIRQEMVHSGWILLIAQALIVPWTCTSVLIMNRHEAVFFANG